MLLILLQACGGSEETTPSGANGDPDTPVLASVGNRALLLNEMLDITLSATDPNGDSFDFTTNRITGIEYPFDFDATTNPNIATWDNVDTFSWQPTATGVFQAKFTVTDQSQMANSDSETVTFAIFESQAISTAQWQTLYTSNCASCHGPNGSSGSAGLIVSVEPNSITAAISQIGAMGSINLNADQTIAISAFLNSVAQ